LKKLIDCQKKVLKFKNTTIVKEPLKIMMKPNEQIQTQIKKNSSPATLPPKQQLTRTYTENILALPR